MINKEFCEAVTSVSLGGIDVKYNTWELCERAINENIPGDFVEAGVYAGTHPMIMAKVASLYDKNRKIHLFDSFEGVPKVRQERDKLHSVPYDQYGNRTVLTDKLESCGTCIQSVENVKNHFKNFGVPLDNCIFHKGWFQETLPKTEIPILSVVRLDVDLLESNEICMRYMYPKLSMGGFLITDDWGAGDPYCEHPWRQHFYDLIHELGFNKPEVIPVQNQTSTAWWRKI